MPSQKLLKQLFDYDPDTGNLYRKSNGAIAGHDKWKRRAAGHDKEMASGKRYRYVKVKQRAYHAARLIWIIVYGLIPRGMCVDHIDQNPLNNKLSNLRLVTPAENARNRPLRADNTTGCTGVFRYKKYNNWVAKFRVNGKDVHIGYFDTFEEAKAARLAAIKPFFHENHGRKPRSSKVENVNHSNRLIA